MLDYLAVGDAVHGNALHRDVPVRRRDAQEVARVLPECLDAGDYLVTLCHLIQDFVLEVGEAVEREVERLARAVDSGREVREGRWVVIVVLRPTNSSRIAGSPVSICSKKRRTSCLFCSDIRYLLRRTYMGSPV